MHRFIDDDPFDAFDSEERVYREERSSGVEGVIRSCAMRSRHRRMSFRGSSREGGRSRKQGGIPSIGSLPMVWYSWISFFFLPSPHRWRRFHRTRGSERKTCPFSLSSPETERLPFRSTSTSTRSERKTFVDVCTICFFKNVQQDPRKETRVPDRSHCARLVLTSPFPFRSSESFRPRALETWDRTGRRVHAWWKLRRFQSETEHGIASDPKRNVLEIEIEMREQRCGMRARAASLATDA